MNIVVLVKTFKIKVWIRKNGSQTSKRTWEDGEKMGFTSTKKKLTNKVANCMYEREWRY